jgi:hypothetical protein
MSKRFWTALLIGAAATAAGAQQQPQLDRTSLPIKEPDYPPITEFDARNVKPPPRFEIKAPAGAPNVLIILIDDMGFGMSSAFGGPIHMPTLERLAAGGLKYNRFHTTALCSPTRTALLSGRNHHMNNMGAITEAATGFPGNTGQRPDNVAPLAEMLRLNGYSTAFFGKNHETAAWEVSPSGPTDRWPTRSGFDKFYGFIGGETNQWAPAIYDGTTRVEPPHDPNYHFTVDMTNQAIAWAQFQHALTPDKPFYMYFATGATHAPHHVPKEWIDKNKGRFDGGWDKMREETLARQIEMGVVPKGTKLAGKPKDIKDWDKLSADEKKALQWIPWGVILMVCGVTMLTSLLDKTGGLDRFAQLVGRVSTPRSVPGVFGLMSGVLSVYSSTSGVVLPALLPTVPKLILQLGGGDPFAIACSVVVVGHLVDSSPLSTIGALCIASAPPDENRQTLFNQMLAWGLSMSIVGAVACYVCFGGGQ